MQARYHGDKPTCYRFRYVSLSIESSESYDESESEEVSWVMSCSRRLQILTFLLWDWEPNLFIAPPRRARFEWSWSPIEFLRILCKGVMQGVTWGVTFGVTLGVTSSTLRLLATLIGDLLVVLRRFLADLLRDLVVFLVSMTFFLDLLRLLLTLLLWIRFFFERDLLAVFFCPLFIPPNLLAINLSHLLPNSYTRL